MDRILVGMGELLWDMLPDGRKPGGAPANFAWHVSQFGFDGRVVSAVGDDSLGHEILDVLDSKKIGHAVENVPFPTGTVQVELDSNGIPNYEIKQGVAWDNISFTSEMETLASRTEAVCFGSLAQRNVVSRDAIRRFIGLMPKNSLKIFDINLRQDFYDLHTIETSMGICNILKINDEELELVTPLMNLEGSGTEQRCRCLMDRYGLEILVLTCGINGSYVFGKETVSFEPTPKVQVADTVGAGDSFTAAFTAGILSGLSLKDSHKLAAEVSAFVCTQEGAMPVLPEALKDFRNHGIA